MEVADRSAGVCLSLGISSKWSEDFSNTVLACAACNGFCNRYSPAGHINVDPLTDQDFYDLRDRIETRGRKGRYLY
jgi:hypothetical protein